MAKDRSVTGTHVKAVTRREVRTPRWEMSTRWNKVAGKERKMDVGSE